MSPGQQYYVHAYQDGAHLKSSEAISTENYPDALPAAITTESERDLRATPDTPGTPGAPISDSPLRALWGMDMWTKNIDDAAIIDAADNHSDKIALRRIEVGSGEILYLPIRSIQTFPDQNTCFSGAVSKLFLRTGFNTGAVNNAVHLAYPPKAGNSYHADNPEGGSVLFHGHPFQGARRPYYDMMGQIDTTKYSEAWITSNCAPTANRILKPSFTLAAP